MANNNSLYFFMNFIRINDVFKWTVISFIGFLLGISTLSVQEYIVPFVVFLISTFCIMSFTFAINNYYDAESDRKNPRRMHSNAIASKEIGKTTAKISIVVFVIVPILISLFFKREVFFLCLFLIFWMGVYSAPPLRLKGRPGIDMMWHFIAFVSMITWGSFITGSLQPLVWLVAVSIGVFGCIGQAWNHFVDYEFDKGSGTRTFAVRFGLEKTKKTIKILIVIHIFMLLLLLMLYMIHDSVALFTIVIGIVLGFILLRPKKDGFPTKKSYEFFLATIVGGTFYISCILFHLITIMDITFWKIF